MELSKVDVQVRYERSDAGIQAMLNGPDALESLLAQAEADKGYAQAISPRSTVEQRAFFADRFDDASILTRPGFADSFDVTPTTVSGFPGGPRVGAVLANTAAHAAAVEFGNRATPRGHHVLGRTAAQHTLAG